MNTKTKILISGFIALSLVLSIVALNKNSTTIQTSDKIVQVGSLPGPNIQSNYFCINGICRYYYNMRMKNATTSPCQIVTPAFPTVLVPNSLHAKLIVASSTASYLTIATSTANSTATTTLIANGVWGANSVDEAVIATTTTSSMPSWQFGTSTTINFGRSGGLGWGATTDIQGYCQATFEKL